MIKIFFDFSRQCKYLQLEKLSSIGFETPIQKRLANNILEGWAKRTPPGLIGLSFVSWSINTTQHVKLNLNKKLVPKQKTIQAFNIGA